MNARDERRKWDRHREDLPEPPLETVRLARKSLQLRAALFWGCGFGLVASGALCARLSWPIGASLVLIVPFMLGIYYALYLINSRPCPRCGHPFLKMIWGTDFPSLSAPCQSCGFVLRRSPETKS
jgi:hypothetical protein